MGWGWARMGLDGMGYQIGLNLIGDLGIEIWGCMELMSSGDWGWMGFGGSWNGILFRIWSEIGIWLGLGLDLGLLGLCLGLDWAWIGLGLSLHWIGLDWAGPGLA